MTLQDLEWGYRIHGDNMGKVASIALSIAQSISKMPISV